MLDSKMLFAMQKCQKLCCLYIHNFVSPFQNHIPQLPGEQEFRFLSDPTWEIPQVFSLAQIRSLIPFNSLY